MTPAHCDFQLRRLTILKGLPEDVVEYFAALQDVPDDLFTNAVGHALKTRHWFPTPAELRADCDAVRVTAPTPAPAESHVEELPGGARDLVLKNQFNGIELRLPIKRIWRFDCEACLDSGWASRSCPALACGRRGEHDPHEWVEHCSCIDWNPTIRRRKESTARFSQAPEKVNS